MGALPLAPTQCLLLAQQLTYRESASYAYRIPVSHLAIEIAILRSDRKQLSAVLRLRNRLGKCGRAIGCYVRS